MISCIFRFSSNNTRKQLRPYSDKWSWRLASSWYTISAFAGICRCSSLFTMLSCHHLPLRLSWLLKRKHFWVTTPSGVIHIRKAVANVKKLFFLWVIKTTFYILCQLIRERERHTRCINFITKKQAYLEVVWLSLPLLPFTFLLCLRLSNVFESYERLYSWRRLML